MELKKFTAKEHKHPSLRKPSGVSVIDHKIRFTLGISCKEYVIIDCLYRRNKRHKVGGMAYIEYYKELGFEPEEIQGIIKSLKEKKLLSWNKEKERIETSKSWNDFFDDDKNFDILWQICPTGNKQQAVQNFLKIKNVPFNILSESLQNYVNSKDDKKFLMHLHRWLDPKLKHWEDNLTPIESNSPIIDMHDDSVPNSLF
jgi:hypothetical protein